MIGFVLRVTGCRLQVSGFGSWFQVLGVGRPWRGGRCRRSCLPAPPQIASLRSGVRSRLRVWSFGLKVEG